MTAIGIILILMAGFLAGLAAVPDIQREGQGGWLLGIATVPLALGVWLAW